MLPISLECFIKFLYADRQGKRTNPNSITSKKGLMAGALWTHLWILREDVVNQSLVPGPECPATSANP